MTLNWLEIKIPNRIKTNPLALLLFITAKLYLNFLNLLVVRFFVVVLVVLYIDIYLLKIFFSSEIIQERLFNLFLIILMFLLMLSFEEFFHAAVCIQKGKLNELKSLKISFLEISIIRKLIIFNASIKFEGKFSKLDVLHINSGGPIGVFCILMITILMLSFITNQYLNYLLISLLIPIGSLIPFKMLVESDGSKIVRISKELNLSIINVFKEIFQSIILIIQYIVGRSSNLNKDTVFLHNLAYEYVTINKFDKAESILKKILNENPDDSDACSNLSWIYMKTGMNLEDAIALSNKALKLNHSEPSYYDTLGLLYSKIGKETKAKKFIENALALDPKNSEFIKHLANINKGIKND